MKAVYFIAGLFLVLFATASFAMMPPKYLEVPKWQSCTDTITKDAAQFVCLPDKKPKDCPMSSWRTLARHKLLDRCSQ